LFLVFIYLLATFLIAFFIGYDSFQFKLLLILALNQGLVAFILYIRSNFAGLHLFVQDSIISVLDRVLLIIICSILLWGGITSEPFQIEWFVYAQSISYFTTLLICVCLMFRQTTNLTFKWDTAFALVILKRSFPYAMLILLMTIYYRIDSVMLERMIGDEQTGIYAQAYRFFEASNMFAYLFAALLLPMFSRMLKLKQSVNELVDCAFKILIGFGIILTVFCCFHSYEIMDFRYDTDILDSSRIFTVLMICFLFISSTYIYGTLLTANGNLFYLNIIAGVGVLLNIVLNFILIPKHQAFGSAIASLITQSLTGLAQLVLCFSIFKLNFNSMLLKFLLFSSGILFLGYIFLEYPGLDHFNYLNALFYIALSCIWLFVTKLIKVSDFYLLIDNKLNLK
jgi:O-antigen/teichoic acid export membrane protein